jgi:L-serine dehydratase
MKRKEALLGKLTQIAEPEVQRNVIEATKTNVRIDSLNRGGGRIRLVDAKPSLEQAIQAAERMGIKLAQR